MLFTSLYYMIVKTFIDHEINIVKNKVKLARLINRKNLINLKAKTDEELIAQCYILTNIQVFFLL